MVQIQGKILQNKKRNKPIRYDRATNTLDTMGNQTQ